MNSSKNETFKCMYSKRKQYVGIDRAQGRIQLFKRGGGQTSTAHAIFFKELALKVSILIAQNRKLLIKYVKLLL